MRTEHAAGFEFLRNSRALMDRLIDTQWGSIAEAAQLFTDAAARGKTIHAFGTGHSHMLAEEVFYRAGGLVQIKPILFEGLMLHASAPLSTSLERLPGLADALLMHHP